MSTERGGLPAPGLFKVGVESFSTLVFAGRTAVLRAIAPMHEQG